MKRTLLTAALLICTMLLSPAFAGISPDVTASDREKPATVLTGVPKEKEKQISLTAGGYASWLGSTAACFITGLTSGLMPAVK